MRHEGVCMLHSPADTTVPGTTTAEPAPARLSPCQVALVSAPYDEGPQLVLPLGLMNIAAYAEDKLGERVDVRLYDFAGYEKADLAPMRRLAAHGVEVVAFSVYSSHVPTVIAWAQELRRLLPGVRLIAGGPHATLAWSEFVACYGHIFDAVVAGEGERPFTELLLRHLEGLPFDAPPIPGVGVRTADGTSVLPPVGPTVETDEWVNPFRSKVAVGTTTRLVYNDHVDRRTRSAVALTTSRSCPMKCYFCSIIAMPDKYRSAKPDQLVGWLREAMDEEPFEHAYFMDADFFTSRSRVLAFAGALHEAFPDLTWSTSATVGHLIALEDKLPYLKECGLRFVEMGIEAGSDRELDFLGKKNFGKPATAVQSVQAVSALQRLGLGVGVDYIMFYPHQTLEDLALNLVFLRRADLVDEPNSDHYFTELMLYPGTPLRTFYENLRGKPFDLELLPELDDLYIDGRVLRIRDLFRGEFRARYLERHETLLDRLVTAARQAQPENPARARALRFAEVRLRHVPYRVLEALIRNEGTTSLDSACPWLEEAYATAEALLASARPEPAQLVGAGH
ncbi:hypothetical protein DN069_30900 [Streptacidiphilus pinicola]|uniref:Uncharacterized protein n=2 Tax=Streptacidiphilus pinicola TaxID=2219663 RepID=A0A2X0K2L8_9ACTN|nr:hypothetical protein DN069_30900 [Streptacidiphilus pinicola]